LHRGRGDADILHQHIAVGGVVIPGRCVQDPQVPGAIHRLSNRLTNYGRCLGVAGPGKAAVWRELGLAAGIYFIKNKVAAARRIERP
jgi:protein involved in ribonucleotide reduction